MSNEGICFVAERDPVNSMLGFEELPRTLRHVITNLPFNLCVACFRNQLHRRRWQRYREARPMNDLEDGLLILAHFTKLYRSTNP